MAIEIHAVRRVVSPKTLSRRIIERIAASIYSPPLLSENDSQAELGILVVCISDTHNTQPEIPNGDLLIHAGDLSEHGTFPEIQRQLDWLNTQPHTYKVVIAGNHGLLLDTAFAGKAVDNIGEVTGQSREDLDRGSLIYFQSSSTTLSFGNGRSVNIYGCPLTP